MSLHVQKPGLFTTIQDAGRPGHGRWGVSPGGAMDPLALALANRLVGNSAQAAALEVTALGPELVFEEEATFAVTGADLSATLEGIRLPLAQAHRARSGQVLKFGARVQGARAYVAVAGGLARGARPFMGSVATDIETGLGGLSGRPLRAGDVLELEPQPSFQPRTVPSGWERWYEPRDVVRFIPEEGTRLLPEALERFTGSRFRISPRSNRVGYRLEGTPLPTESTGMQLSEPVAPGTLQLPPDGNPIVLMADRQTTGGYPRLGHVIRADVPKLAQLWLGDRVSFRAVALEEARQALHELQSWLDTAVV
ncbi:biotin-dependent carboxyltransferase family protein [Hyalangium minutum]|uniref:Allophanate hydrolase 2 subunit 2 n=1 Tax=Hyalangium minutum TaxID=394096 RepID=A0A085WGK4_9BACT|nr:biotin-dependent carboxyltransferase family protein [Hyalangium minutum]KFE66817.1 Allophanate hydrolase 2 subunit 2 [Hyalangium minutum]